MPHFVDINSCLQTVKLIGVVGEMAPFPFIQGVALCTVVILENIQKAENNRSDMRELAKSIVDTLVAVRDTVIEHGPTSMSHFQNICVEFQDYMTELLSKLNNECRSCGIQWVLKAKKISDDISAYWQQVQAVKEDFLVWDLIPRGIYLKASVPRSCHNGSCLDIDEYHTVIYDHPKIVCIFRAQAGQQEQVMQQFQKEVDRRLHLRLLNISQLFSVCTSPTFLALIMHSPNIEWHLYYVLSNESSVKGVLLFFLQMYNDLQFQSIANYLAEQAWIQQQEQDDSDGKTLHAQTGCFDEHEQVILNDLSLDEVQTYSSIEKFDPFKSDSNDDDNAKIHEITYWDLTVGFADSSEDEVQGLSGLWSESNGTHFIEGIDSNFLSGKYTDELDSISLIGILIYKGYWIVFAEYYCQNLAILQL
ncbi:hypothetical protein ARMGADRAFT_1092341 [Armillaria gallica]|uniref:Uncharacterized protein n=1 Tax=Armillaria gallica TaxID=47427 RepID=A0A2H3CYG3_ARMGA|nr:hypothetical protein ARMGADRAFT_1092341 [Armillaria gallica]